MSNESEAESRAAKKIVKKYEGPTFVATFDVKAEKWQSDLFEKTVFPAAAEFQNMMNRYVLEKYTGLCKSDEKFGAACRFPRIEDAISMLDAVKEKIDKRAKAGKPLDERDSKFLDDYEARHSELNAEMSKIVELFSGQSNKKKSKKDISYECFLYRKNAFTEIVINDKYLQFGYNPTKMSGNGLRSLAGAMLQHEKSKNGHPFSYNGITLGIGRGVADRVWSAWQRKVCKIESWKDKNRIDVDKDESESIKFQNHMNAKMKTYQNGYMVFMFDNLRGKRREIRLDLLVGKNDWYRKRCLLEYGEPQEAAIVRTPKGTGYRYSVQVTLRGNPPELAKFEPKEGVVGIDIGPGGATCWGKALGAKKFVVKQTARESNMIKELQRMIDSSDRANNPDCFDENGKAKRGVHLRHTKNCMKLIRKQGALRHRIAERIKNTKGFILNHEILPYGNRFVFEETEAKKWAKRDEEGRGKNGKKKRYGKSVQQFGPKDFVNRLRQKAERNGQIAQEVPCGIAATQFNPIEREFFEHKVEERTLHWGDDEIDRDAGAAFNLAHVADKIEMEKKTSKYGKRIEVPVKTYRNYDMDGIYQDYDKFIEDEKKMKKDEKSR